MMSFGLSVKNEFYKLVHKKKYIVFLIIGVVFCLFNIGGSMLIEKISEGYITVRIGLMVSMLSFLTKILSPLVIFMAATDLFCNEFQEDTMKGVLVQPITRLKIMLSKSAAIFIMCAVYFVVMYLSCFIIQVVTGGGANDALVAVGAYIIDLIPVICMIGFAVFINMVIKSPTLVMLLTIALYAFMQYLNFYSASFGQMVFTAYLELHKIIIGTAIPFTSIITKFGILFGSSLILFVLSYMIFDKRDI